jgi:hypothetical protein
LGTKGGKGPARDGNQRPPAQVGLLFTRPPPASSAATISKMPLKPPHSSPTDSTGVTIPNARTLTEYDAVALLSALGAAVVLIGLAIVSVTLGVAPVVDPTIFPLP